MQRPIRPGWLPATVRTDWGTVALVWLSGGDEMVLAVWDGAVWLSWGEGDPLDVTHWHPAPATGPHGERHVVM